ncbi:hypothetical protein E4U46_003310 [Claviceps purpurea]|nr:hypothetical protein E4U23_001139 [Claviceps purpurea]KAG6288437.1 hypothetical protein E4U46_003310 [Claviceps purpurea]
MWRHFTSRVPGTAGNICAGLHGSFRVPRSLSFRRCATTHIASLPASSLDGESKSPAPINNRAEKPTADENGDDLPIRERLRQWLNENDVNTAAMPADAVIYWGVTNNINRTQSTGSSEMDELRTTPESLTEGGIVDEGQAEAEISSVASDSRNPGDLVEMRQLGSRVPVFAVYIGWFGDRHHFYAANGRWITSMGFSSLFSVSQFVKEEELRPLLAKIPKNATPERYEELRRLEEGPSREDGIAIIEKLTNFRMSAEAIYQANMAKLDRARELLSDPKEFKYLSLFQIADILLPASLKEGKRFSPPALYAVHTALSRNEISFHPLSASAECHRRDHLFEIFPSDHVNVIHRVVTWVQEYTNATARQSRLLSTSKLERIHLGSFILQAREAVARSRESRGWTPHGILRASPSVTLPRVDWSPVSENVITFLEWWASYDLFDAGSRYHAYGALILRSLHLYEDIPLDQSTAWTLLQEMGIIAPWEIPSRYKVRFPGTSITKGGGIARPAPNTLQTSIRPDVAKDARTSSKGSSVFCIDAPSTTLIDDGVSLERTDRPDECWIHVHVADPASTIQPKSELGKFVELIPENIYLPGHFQAMLPLGLGEGTIKDGTSDALIAKHSLKAGAPSLTFSALVNESGDILDYKIAPTTVESVTYLDPEDVSDFCGEDAPPTPAPMESGYSFDVGALPDNFAATPSRPMSSMQTLDESSKNDILTLSRLTKAIKQKRLAKGAWPYFFPKASVQVAFHDPIPEAEAAHGAVLFPPDPYIKVGQESSSGCSVVSNSMVLAGQIAARWCSERGIPIPYRKDAKSSSAENMDAAFDYATKTIYPLIKKGIPPSVGHRQGLTRLTGGIQLSTEPGPYFLLGLDMYTKATSPLRRYGDLLVHWQVHAALAYERQTGRKLNPQVDDLDHILPFNKAALSETLPLLDMREKMGRIIGRGTVDWMLIALVRAWRFEGKAPPVLRFKVASQLRQGLMGHLDLFGLNAAMDISGINGLCLVKDVQAGDEFEVELADVNVHSRQILVKALKYLGKSASSSSS